jgi:hypothetical protein
MEESMNPKAHHTHTARESSRRLLRAAGTLALALGTLTGGACNESTGSLPDSGIRYGQSVAVGAGTARTYVEFDKGVPVEVGVALSESALAGLPDQHTPGGVVLPDGHHWFEYVLDLPDGNPTPFKHFVLNWNHHGHQPTGIYDTPHFDFHFYTITDAERRSIAEADPRFAERAARIPAPDFLPSGYVSTEQAVETMGVHWIDAASPELNGQPFTSTMIFGTWDGRVTFIEPMITRDFVLSKTEFSASIPVPEKHAEPGYYPSGYSIRWNEQAKEHRIALTGLAKRS